MHQSASASACRTCPPLADAAGRWLAERPRCWPPQLNANRARCSDHAGGPLPPASPQERRLSGPLQGIPPSRRKTWSPASGQPDPPRENEAFWPGRSSETLRLSGVRLEELLEITHLALVS